MKYNRYQKPVTQADVAKLNADYEVRIRAYLASDALNVTPIKDCPKLADILRPLVK